MNKANLGIKAQLMAQGLRISDVARHMGRTRQRLWSVLSREMSDKEFMRIDGAFFEMTGKRLER